ncbi:MAG: hypothetical protein EKK46_09155 [Rhodocyclaceae bacterium]|nr:MAG: hypothetical protein EKK46_09155 [Rhodocyclaceae bacterium]
MAKKKKNTQTHICVVTVDGLGFISTMSDTKKLFTFSPDQARVFHDLNVVDALVNSLKPTIGNRTVRLHFLGDV